MRRTTRRTFLKGSAGVVGALSCPHFVRALGTNDKLRIAMIGVGGRGGANLGNVTSEQIVALCDVDSRAVERAASKHPSARKTNDFRKVFDHANEFDAVMVSTCEHTHAFATLPALQMGKHVYCEKPLTYNIQEARIIREAAAKTKVATQMGNQNHANDNFRRVVELVQGGCIGAVSEVHIWVSRAWGLQSPEDAKANHDIVTLTDIPTDSAEVPAHLSWDLWIGPAPMRKFHPVYVPGPKWYRFWAFGNGTMSDLGSHWNDLPFWALKLKAPKTVEAFGPKAHPEIAPASMTAKYEFPARGDMPPVTMTWYQGVDKPTLFKEKKIPLWNDGMLFVGSKGMILSNYNRHVLLPEQQYKDFERPAQTIAKSKGHWAEWVHACKTGEPTLSNFEYAGWLTESNHLGNVAFRAGKKLIWDAEQMKATNCPDAEQFIKRDYRKGWKLA